jgi:hypothetical protein
MDFNFSRLRLVIPVDDPPAAGVRGDLGVVFFHRVT